MRHNDCTGEGCGRCAQYDGDPAFYAAWWVAIGGAGPPAAGCGGCGGAKVAIYTPPVIQSPPTGQKEDGRA